jgi:hypothetical protein
MQDETSIDTPPLSPLKTDADTPWRPPPTPHFAGFVETPFSTPTNRFYFKERGPRRIGSGSHAVVQEYARCSLL